MNAPCTLNAGQNDAAFSFAITDVASPTSSGSATASSEPDADPDLARCRTLGDVPDQAA